MSDGLHPLSHGKWGFHLLDQRFEKAAERWKEIQTKDCKGLVFTHTKPQTIHWNEWVQPIRNMDEHPLLVSILCLRSLRWIQGCAFWVWNSPAEFWCLMDEHNIDLDVTAGNRRFSTPLSALHPCCCPQRSPCPRTPSQQSQTGLGNKPIYQAKNQFSLENSLYLSKEKGPFSPQDSNWFLGILTCLHKYFSNQFAFDSSVPCLMFVLTFYSLSQDLVFNSIISSVKQNSNWRFWSQFPQQGILHDIKYSS